MVNTGVDREGIYKERKKTEVNLNVYLAHSHTNALFGFQAIIFAVCKHSGSPLLQPK